MFVCLFHTLFHLPFVYLFVYLLYVVVDCFCFGGWFTLTDSFVVFVGFSCLSCVFVCVLQLMVFCDCFSFKPGYWSLKKCFVFACEKRAENN